MGKQKSLRKRMQELFLAYLYRRERRRTWEQAAQTGIMSPCYHMINGKRVVSYRITPPLHALPSVALAKRLDRLMSDGNQEGGIDHYQGPVMSERSSGNPQMLGNCKELQRLLNGHVSRPPVNDVALAIQIAKAITAIGADEQDVLAMLKGRQLRILLHMPLLESASSLKAMIIDGVFGGEPGEREEQSWRGSSESVSLIWLSKRRFAIFDLEKADSEREVQLRFDRAIREGDSVVLIAGGVEASAWAKAATDIYLDVGAITVDTLALLIALQIGVEQSDCIQMVEAFWNGGKHLRLVDIAAAVAPQRTAIDIIKRLNELQAYRQDADQRESADRSTGGRSGGKKSGGSSWIDVLHPVEAQSATAIDPEKPPLRVEELHGYGAAKIWALDLKTDLKSWREGEVEWADMSTKILLHGAPGTGKSTFARALPTTLQIPLLATSVATWLEPGYLGDVLKRIDQTFRLARELAPCVVFVDEFDGISKRDAGGRRFDDYWINVVNKVLECLDGALKSEGIVFVAATNRPDAIDPALLRSGRIEEHVQIPLPDLSDLVGILKYHLGRSMVQCNPTDHAGLLDADCLHKLCARLVGSSGADIERVVKHARARARKEKRQLEISDLTASVDSLRPRGSALLVESLAVHEAGHAVAFSVLGLAIAHSVAIAEATGGRTLISLKSDDIQFECGLENTLVALLAGREAERLLLGRMAAGSGGGLDSDLAKATSLALQLEATLGFASDQPLVFRHEYAAEPGPIHDQALLKRVNQRLEQAEQQAKVLVQENARVIEGLANLLREKLVVDGEELRAILAPLGPEPQRVADRNRYGSGTPTVS